MPGRFTNLRNQEKFWQLVALARVMNALRFVQRIGRATPPIAAEERPPPPPGDAKTHCSIPSVSSMRACDKMGKDYRDLPSFHDGLRDL